MGAREEGVIMSLEGPQLRFVRVDDARDPLDRALDLMRQVEDLLEQAPTPSRDGRSPGTHSTRFARAMAASLVDELEALVRGRPRGDVGSG